MFDLCVECNENEMIDGFRCFGSVIDFYYAEGLLFTTKENA